MTIAHNRPVNVSSERSDLTLPAQVEQWSLYEIVLNGPSEGNPFLDVSLSAEFRSGEISVSVAGFYDGEGVYRIRFMPESQGQWNFLTISTAEGLHGKEGAFLCVKNLHQVIMVRSG